MKAKILMLAVLFSFSVASYAQSSDKEQARPMRGQGNEMRMGDDHKGPGAGLKLTDAQKESFKKSMMAMHKQLLPLRNELGEAKAHQKTLESAEKPDFTAINKNLEKIGTIKVEMEKIQTKNRLDMRAQLTDEQRLAFDMHKAKMMQNKGSKGKKPGMHQGMRPGMKMQGAKCEN